MNFGETSKANRLRSPEFIKKYLSGKVIDIGGGNDLVNPFAERFDIEDGDANHITRYRQPLSYDTVYSSHCLEHMYHPARALNEWWQLVAPGGHLIITVPEEDLYEQGIWPSYFNADHKVTFRLDRDTTWSPVSIELRELISPLPSSKIIFIGINDHSYNRKLTWRWNKNRIRRHNFLSKGIYSLARRLPSKIRDCVLSIALPIFKVPIDQLRWESLAQIEVIVEKLKS
jgi:SAM-dependent methyltransferase